MATRLGRERGTRQQGNGAGREQTEKKYVIYLRERRRRKTPLRLANTYKSVYIHITQYRGVSAVYCTFFYIY